MVYGNHKRLWFTIKFMVYAQLVAALYVSRDRLVQRMLTSCAEDVDFAELVANSVFTVSNSIFTISKQILKSQCVCALHTTL